MTKSKATIKGSQNASIQSLNSRMDRIMKMIPKGTFSNVGTAAGMAAGGPAGATIGRVIGSGLSAITGYGDYEVSMNTLNKVSTSVDMVPAFVRNDHSVRVTHREFVRDLVVPGDPSGFVNSTQPINPSNGLLFPWLASMAKQYQQYRIHGMIVEYKSMSSDYAASGPLGTVCIATNYNVLDKPYPSKIALENSEFAVSCKPSMSLVHALECDPKVTGRDILYVRDLLAQSTNTSDARLYDAGLLQIATAGLPGAPGSTMGEIWISYDIEFYKPVLPVGVSVPTVPGFALTSQRDGSENPENGAITAMAVNQATTALTVSQTRNLYLANGDSPTLSGDTGLYGTAFTINGTGQVQFLRNGLYKFRWALYGSTTATNYALTPNAYVPSGTTAQFAESGSVGTISTSTDVLMTPRSVGIGVTNGQLAVVESTVIIQGMPSGENAFINCPEFTTNDGALAAATINTFNIMWIQETPASILVTA
jgi:hypothetical protein